VSECRLGNLLPSTSADSLKPFYINRSPVTALEAAFERKC
jgi:hypothetical protein